MTKTVKIEFEEYDGSNEQLEQELNNILKHFLVNKVEVLN